MAQGTWRGALARLTEMGAIKPKRQSRTEPKPLEITDSSDAAHDRIVVSREVERLVVGSNGWFDNWIASLATGFNFYPTEEQLANAARWLEHRSANLFSADTYNDCRKSLVRQNIWPEKSPSGIIFSRRTSKSKFSSRSTTRTILNSGSNSGWRRIEFCSAHKSLEGPSVCFALHGPSNTAKRSRPLYFEGLHQTISRRRVKKV